MLCRLQVSSCQYGHILNVWERAHGCYPVTSSTLHLLITSLKFPNDNMIATIVYIMQAVFVSSQNWRYNSHKDKEDFCKCFIVVLYVISIGHLLLKLSYKILENGTTKDVGSLQKYNRLV